MLKNLFAKFLKGTFLNITASLAALLLFAVNNYHPNLNTVDGWVWTTVIVGALTGLAHALERLANWNPSLSQK